MVLYLRILSLTFATLFLSACDESMLLHELDEDATEEEVTQVATSPSSRTTVEALIKNELVVLDSDGNVQNLVGFETKIEFESTQSIVESENFQEMYQNDEKLFTFEAPKGVQAELSEPILKTNSGLSLTGSSYTCEEQFYQSSEPTIGDVIDVSNESKVCGDIEMVVCIRMAEDDANITGTSDYAYTETPNMSFNLPCKEDSFAGLLISLDGGKDSSSEELVEVTMSHSKSVVEVFLTESLDCRTGGEWAPLDGSSIMWNFAWSETKTSGSLYAKFKDIYGEVSNCFTDTISHISETSEPVLTMNTPVALSSSNLNSYTLDGKCSEESQDVKIKIGGVSKTAVCTSAAWLLSNLDLSSVVSSAPLTVTAEHGNASGTKLAQVSKTLYKECDTDGSLDCITTSQFPSIDTNSYTASNIISGHTFGGIAGSAIAAHSDCSADNQTDCAATSTYKSADTSAYQASDILSGKTIAGVAGSATPPPDCSSISVGGTWVSVPGDATHGTRDFCVMKYEAKNNSGVPYSEAANTPWGSISLLDAITECASLGAGFHLITNDEWMTIASNAAAQGTNWDGGTVGTNNLARGHTDNNPNTICEADASDTNAYVQTDCSTRSSSGTFNQRRTHTLSNGEVIWDLAGNAYEWTSYYNNTDKPYDATDGAPMSAWREYNVIDTFGAMKQTDLVSQAAIDGSWTSSQSIGQYYARDSGGGALVRGGTYNTHAKGGLFNFVTHYVYGNKFTYIGFRCAVARP